MKAKPKTSYVTASPATWELIRAAYLSGQSAATVAARFGVSVGALRKRAGRDGWTKRDFTAAGAAGLAPQVLGAPAPAAAPAAGDPSPLAALHSRAVPPQRRSALSVARMAVNQAAEGLMAGDADAALRHVRAAEAIVRLEAIFAAKEDWGDEIEDAREDEARQSALDEFVFQLAGEVAGLLVTGRPVPPGLHSRAERWRAQYADALAARADLPTAHPGEGGDPAAGAGPRSGFQEPSLDLGPGLRRDERKREGR